MGYDVHSCGCRYNTNIPGKPTLHFDDACDTHKEIMTLKQWVADLHSGMYINCVYCGHQYGPADETPSTMADILKEHIRICPKHPMSEMNNALFDAQLVLEKIGTVGHSQFEVIRVIKRIKRARGAEQ